MCPECCFLRIATPTQFTSMAQIFPVALEPRFPVEHSLPSVMYPYQLSEICPCIVSNFTAKKNHSYGIFSEEGRRVILDLCLIPLPSDSTEIRGQHMTDW